MGAWAAGGSTQGVPPLSPPSRPRRRAGRACGFQRDVGCPMGPDSLHSLPALGLRGQLQGVAGPTTEAEPAPPLPLGVMGTGLQGAGMAPSCARGQGLGSTLG